FKLCGHVLGARGQAAICRVADGGSGISEPPALSENLLQMAGAGFGRWERWLIEEATSGVPQPRGRFARSPVTLARKTGAGPLALKRCRPVKCSVIPKPKGRSRLRGRHDHDQAHAGRHIES